jgi:hypothetical protein
VGPEELDPATIDGFIDALGEEGVPREILEHPDVPRYLSWRARIAFADRVNHQQHALEFLAERDRVLEKAIEVLEGVHTQSELFAAVEAAANTRAAADSIALAPRGGS